MTTAGTRKSRGAPFAWAALLVLTGMGCDDDTTRWDLDGDAGADADADADADGDGDADGDADSCEPVQWGSGLVKGNPVANWQMYGFADRDGDHIVEHEDVDFTLDEIHCRDKEALVVIVGDSS